MAWEIQANFFKKESIKAWLGAVPYYITSNLVTADVYITVALRFIQDHVQQKDYDPKQPFYILEIGTGPGKFSFYAVKRLHKLIKQLKLDHVKIKYIMSDFTQNNIDFWKQHPQIKSLLDLDPDLLDFASYNTHDQDSLHLQRSNITLKNNTLNNPVIAFANYLFDSIPHDIFHFENGLIYEGLTNISTPKDNLDKHKTPIKTEALEVEFQYNPIKADGYYRDSELNQILANYAKTVKNSSFTFPISGIKALKQLRKLSKDKFLMIASDKAYALPNHLENLNSPRITLHGNCFSVMVNLHALGEYVKLLGGEYIAQSERRSRLKTCVFLMGKKLNDLPETMVAVDNHIESFSVVDFFNMHEHMKKSIKDCELRILVAHMNFCHWDPHIFRLFSSRINECILHEQDSVKNAFIEGMPKIMDNFYYMPNNQDIPFEIGTFFQTMRDYPKALEYYQLSETYFGKNLPLLFNRGLCSYLTDKFEVALDCFKAACEIDPSSRESKEWLDRIKQELSYDDTSGKT